MAGIKISALPSVPSSQLTDIYPIVQGGVTYQASLTQLQTLFNANLSYLPLAGGTMSGAINMGSHLINAVTDPVSAQDAATKNYVDTSLTNLISVFVARLASTGALTATYSNGAAGVGATLTNATTQAAFALDGVNAALNDYVLIKNQASTFQNGYYKVTNLGSGSTNWVLTRATQYDQPSEIQPGDLFIITAGNTLVNTSWIQTSTVTTIGSDAITFSQYSVALPIPVASGGTGATTASGARTNLSAAALGANSDITSLTGLTGVIQAPTAITSSAGLNLLTFTYTASAVNYLNITNAATGNNPTLTATGSDSLVAMILKSKGGIFAAFDTTATYGASLELYNAAGNHYLGFITPVSQASSILWTLPSADATASGQAMISNASGVLSFSATPISTAPVRTVYTSGSGNYTTAANVLWLEVKVIGGGAGGGSSGTAGQASGTAGNASSFGTLTANGGSAGSSYYSGGIGGTASGGDLNISGGSGAPGGQIGTAVSGQFGGGNGGDSFLGGSGTGGGIGKVAGSVGGTNSGGGGGGGSTDTTSGSVSGGGGGAGGYSTKIISPTASQVFAYVVGAAANGASAGTNGAAGGNGAAGIIIVTAHYQ